MGRCFFSQPSSDGITNKKPYVVDILLYRPISPHPVLLGWSKLNLVLLDQLRLAEGTLVVAVISIVAYPFLGFLRPNLLP